jgi:hypothetical protein
LLLLFLRATRKVCRQRERPDLNFYFGSDDLASFIGRRIRREHSGQSSHNSQEKPKRQSDPKLLIRGCFAAPSFQALELEQAIFKRQHNPPSFRLMDLKSPKELRQHIKCVRAARLSWPCDAAKFPFDLATRKACARAESAKAFSTWWSFESPHLFAHFAFIRDLVANQPAG